jgi:hypothetical protein
MNRTTDQAATKFGAARVATMAITAAATALALSACSTTTGSSASAGSGGTTGGSGTTTGTTTSSTSQGTGVSGATECATSQLSVAQENPSVGAGQYYSTLVFTNTSGSTCTTSGYAGVSYVVANGVQSGNPAVRAGGTIATVTLAPGGKATAVLHDSNGISGYTPQQCQLTEAQGLRIYPPNQKAALFLPWKTSHCAGLSIHPLSIGPITQ